MQLYFDVQISGQCIFHILGYPRHQPYWIVETNGLFIVIIGL
jgi:hypothetical protein